MDGAKVVTDTEFAKKWRMLYPLYFDKSIGRDKGRKVSSSMAIEKPDVADFVQVLSFLKIPHLVEINKQHPRDFFALGRVRYNLTNSDGSFVNPMIKNSRLYEPRIRCDA